MRVLRWLAPMLLLAGLAGGSLASARSPSGPLDGTFGSRGKVKTRIGERSGAWAVAQQRDGKLVAAGSSESGANYDLAVTRYRRNGSRDPRFGARGIVTTDLGGNDSAFAMRVGPDGKIIVAGGTSSGNTAELALARYTSRGALDRTFGAAGNVTAAGLPPAFALALEPDGRIVTGGGAHGAFVVSRFNGDGSRDPSFGTGGTARTTFGMNASLVRSLALQSDGKIVAVGWSAGHEVGQWSLARYLSNGEPDTSFGAGGKVTLFRDVLASSEATAVSIQPDGKIVVLGDTRDGFTLVRLESNGSFDSSFGTEGVTVTQFDYPRPAFAGGLRLQRDGKIVASGGTFDGRTNGDFAVARFTRAGVLDHRFWGGGKLTTAISPTIDECRALVVQRDGRIVLAGEADENGVQGSTFALVRYRKR